MQGGGVWGRIGGDVPAAETPPPAGKPMSVADQIAKVRAALSVDLGRE